MNREVLHPLAAVRNIDPDEIPKDPFNRLMRGKPVEENDKKDEKEREKRSKRSRSRSKSRSRSRSRERGRRDRGRDREKDGSRFGSSRATDNEGRKIKGRGRVVRVLAIIHIMKYLNIYAAVLFSVLSSIFKSVT